MSNEEQSSESRGPSWTLIGAALVVGVVVAMGAILSVQGLRDDDGGGMTSTASSSTSSTAPVKSATDSICGLKGHETSGGLAKPPEATWSLLDGFAVPSTKRAGPGEVEDDGFRFCYARTRDGAVLAAANFVGVGGGDAADREKKILQHLIAPGPGRKVQEQAAGSSDKATSGQSSTAASGGIQISGVRLNGYNDQQANLEILMRADNGAYVSQQFEMHWAEGDWKVALSDNGMLLSNPQPVDGTAGFLPWSGA